MSFRWRPQLPDPADELMLDTEARGVVVVAAAGNSASDSFLPNISVTAAPI